MSKVRDEASFVCPAHHRNSSSDSLDTDINWDMALETPTVGYSSGNHSLLLPFRIMPSNMATKSEKTRSTSSSPASTVMTSELGLVYFFFKTHARNAVKV